MGMARSISIRPGQYLGQQGARPFGFGLDPAHEGHHIGALAGTLSDHHKVAEVGRHRRPEHRDQPAIAQRLGDQRASATPCPASAA